MAKINKKLLAAIANETVTHISQADGLPLLQHTPPLIDVDMNSIQDGKALVRLTPDGQALLNELGNSYANPVAASPYAVISGAVLPVNKRGAKGGGAPVIYPFDQLEIGQSFFVPKSDKHPDPVKTLGSTVSSANMRYSEPTGEMKSVERAKRGAKNKLELDANGNKQIEVKQVAVRKATRKFKISKVEAGKTYGNWTADQDGALIQRVNVE